MSQDVELKNVSKLADHVRCIHSKEERQRYLDIGRQHAKRVCGVYLQLQIIMVLSNISLKVFKLNRQLERYR